MWAEIVGFIKGLFGGSKGTSQTGKDQQAVSGSTAGDHSPMITAGRDVHFVTPTSVVDQNAEDFKDIEEMMPALLAEMREDLAQSSLTRELALVKRGWSFNGTGQFEYYFETYPNLQDMVNILENYRLVMDVTRSNVKIYRMSESFVRYLTKLI